ncbi:MAG: hypothetical protein ABW189_01255 [Rickettsiales bacterium]
MADLLYCPYKIRLCLTNFGTSFIPSFHNLEMPLFLDIASEVKKDLEKYLHSRETVVSILLRASFAFTVTCAFGGNSVVHSTAITMYRACLSIFYAAVLFFSVGMIVNSGAFSKIGTIWLILILIVFIIYLILCAVCLFKALATLSHGNAAKLNSVMIFVAALSYLAGRIFASRFPEIQDTNGVASVGVYETLLIGCIPAITIVIITSIGFYAFIKWTAAAPVAPAVPADSKVPKN